jgi:chromate transporter
MIPVIEREVVIKRGWIKPSEMADVLSIAGAAPGGIGVNAAALVGYRLAGILGSCAAVVGMALPTFAIIFALCLTFAQFSHNRIVDAAFQGIHGAILALIVVAAIRMAKSAVRDKTTLITMIITVFVLYDFHLHPAIIIALGIVSGLITATIKPLFGFKVPLDSEDGKESGASVYGFGDGI